MQIDKNTSRVQLIERLTELCGVAFIVGESGGGQNPKVEAHFRELEDAQDFQSVMDFLPTAPEGERHLSEVFRIVEGAMRGDSAKVKAYAGLLAEKLEADGEANSARWLRQIIEGKAGARIVAHNVEAADIVGPANPK